MSSVLKALLALVFAASFALQAVAQQDWHIWRQEVLLHLDDVEGKVFLTNAWHNGFSPTGSVDVVDENVYITFPDITPPGGNFSLCTTWDEVSTEGACATTWDDAYEWDAYIPFSWAWMRYQ